MTTHLKVIMSMTQNALLKLSVTAYMLLILSMTVNEGWVLFSMTEGEDVILPVTSVGILLPIV